LNLLCVFNRYFRRAGESHEAIASGEARHTLQEGGMANTVKIDIYADPSKPNPTLSLPDVPWYAGITALQAMVIGEALHPLNFSFRVIYRSIYGAFIDSIDCLADEDKPNHYWMLYIDGDEAKVGAKRVNITGGREQDSGSRRMALR
jgi:hypothetical protein